MRFASFLLLAVVASASPTRFWLRDDNDKDGDRDGDKDKEDNSINGTATASDGSQRWETVRCSDAHITDAKVSAGVRWEAADANTSWRDAVAAWQKYTPDGEDAVKLRFSAFVSDFYGGPEGWNCEDPVNTPCSTTVQCDDTKHPAGFLVLNSFAKLHDVYQKYHEALQDAQLSISAAMGDFTSTFAPQLKAKDDSALIKTVIDVMMFGIGIASAGLWNIVTKDAAMFALKGSHGFTKDIVNSAVASSFALAKDNIKAAKDSASVQNDLTAAMGVLFDLWKKTQGDFLSRLFSGSDGAAIAMLDGLLSNGTMNMIPVDINLSGMVDVVNKIIFGQMIPVAWAVAPAAYTPFVLATGDACSDTLPKTLDPWMTQDTHDKTGVCWNGNQFYVLTVGTYRVDVQGDVPSLPDSEPPFQPMAGGTKDVLDGKQWGGVTLDDVVVSAYGGYLRNGRRNGYNVTLDDSAGAVDELMWSAGVRTPGFFSLPVCTSVWNTLMNVAGTPADFPHYPCNVNVERTFPQK
ncbi:hypothetical protein Cob_v003016 [Colletotrichum orbiculare MAFF 240422]|uniref:Uncharacterized protein n=1 Tax=Colletotrichum orbiculare (strain 104-T / ATCC 96160 / CBS 514.97 / LARS 414 / MAFF 240422) TaxID=1213857 RepID=N4VS93_COLOR|nr:hypothetical protein Cob_v003016 [Colletotrichum orbiculare MAFF 240422]